MDHACERHGQRVAHDRGEDARRRGADDEAHGDGAEPEHAELQQEGALHGGLGGAHALERRDGVQLAVQMAGDRAGDADAADEKGREPCQRQEQTDAVELAPERGVGVANVAQPPDGVGERRLQPGRPIRDRRGFRYQRAVAVPHQGAGLDQAGRLQRRVIDHQPGAERESRGELVWLARKHGAHGEQCPANPEPVADPDRKTIEQSFLDRGATAGQGLGEGRAALQAHAVDQRIGAVHGLDLDQRAAGAVLGMGHAPHGDDVGEGRGVRLEVIGRRLAERLRELHQLDIAAEDHPGVAREAGLERLAQGAHGGGGGDAEDQAGEEDAEATHAAAKLAPGDAPRRPHLIGGRRQGISPRRAS